MGSDNLRDMVQNPYGLRVKDIVLINYLTKRMKELEDSIRENIFNANFVQLQTGRLIELEIMIKELKLNIK